METISALLDGYEAELLRVNRRLGKAERRGHRSTIERLEAQSSTMLREVASKILETREFKEFVLEKAPTGTAADRQRALFSFEPLTSLFRERRIKMTSHYITINTASSYTAV